MGEFLITGNWRLSCASRADFHDSLRLYYGETEDQTAGTVRGIAISHSLALYGAAEIMVAGEEP